MRAGRRAGRRKTVETVTTWSSMTSQILALREHLIAARRLDCILEPTKDQVLAEYKKLQNLTRAWVLKSKFKLAFYNTSRWTFASLVG